MCHVIREITVQKKFNETKSVQKNYPKHLVTKIGRSFNAIDKTQEQCFASNKYFSFETYLFEIHII